MSEKKRYVPLPATMHYPEESCDEVRHKLSHLMAEKPEYLSPADQKILKDEIIKLEKKRAVYLEASIPTLTPGKKARATAEYNRIKEKHRKLKI